MRAKFHALFSRISTTVRRLPIDQNCPQPTCPIINASSKFELLVVSLKSCPLLPNQFQSILRGGRQTISNLSLLALTKRMTFTTFTASPSLRRRPPSSRPGGVPRRRPRLDSFTHPKLFTQRHSSGFPFLPSFAIWFDFPFFSPRYSKIDLSPLGHLLRSPILLSCD